MIKRIKIIVISIKVNSTIITVMWFQSYSTTSASWVLCCRSFRRWVSVDACCLTSQTPPWLTEKSLLHNLQLAWCIFSWTSPSHGFSVLFYIFVNVFFLLQVGLVRLAIISTSRHCQLAFSLDEPGNVATTNDRAVTLTWAWTHTHTHAQTHLMYVSSLFNSVNVMHIPLLCKEFINWTFTYASLIYMWPIRNKLCSVWVSYGMLLWCLK